MKITSSKMSKVQGLKLLTRKESQYLDMKSRSITPAKLGKHLSAFANADGGELYIGIAERSDNSFEWSGFPDEEDANGHLQALCEILGSDFTYEFLEAAGLPGSVLKIEVRKTREIIRTADATAYSRRGASSVPVTGIDAVKRLEMDKGIVSFESQTVLANITHITESETVTNFMTEVVPSSNPLSWLTKQQLIVDSKPTVAGVVLFADEPQALLPKRCGIKIYRYKTKEREGTRDTLESVPITIQGCAYSQIKEAEAKVVGIIQNLPVLSSGGFDKVTYPPVTLHEIIANAVLHRDYSIPDDVHIRIFDNRVEVESPGVLPGHVTTSNILDERFARNHSIVRLINKFPDPPNMDVGEGLNTAFKAMKDLRLKEPEIFQKEHSVLVNIKHEALGSPEELIMRYLQDHSSINNSAARSLCHIGSENTVKRIFQRLIKARQIETTPGLKGSKTSYQKTPVASS